MITIDATGATSGIDFEDYIRGGFVADVTGGGFPVFDNGPAFSGEEMLIGYGSGATSKYVLAHGDLGYSFMPFHIVYGTANTIEFGTRGSGSYDSNGFFTGGNVELKITGLALTNAAPTGPTDAAELAASGTVHNFAAAYMAGSAASDEDLGIFADALDTEAQHFKGSVHGDVYTGTTFNDLIEGNGGNDWLGGGSGSDDIDGGEGEDTAIFSDVQSAYTVVRYSNGLITVQKGGEATTLRNVEKLEFGGAGPVDVVDLPETPLARVTIDASGSNGLNFTTYFADYFAKVQLNGVSSYHGGTLDEIQPPGTFDYLNGDQVSFKYRAAGDETGPYTSVVILEGQEIAYDRYHYPGQATGGANFAHGSISGTVDTLIFGTITGDAPASGADLFTGYDAELVISGLDIHDDPGAGGSTSTNPVPTLYYGIRGGILTNLESVLSKYAYDFIGSDGDDVFVGGLFDDIIEGGLGHDQLSGGQGKDLITGGLGDDVIDGGLGNDDLSGGEGKDSLVGGFGDDTLDGAAEKDVLWGDEGDDLLTGGDSRDLLDGGADNDGLDGGIGNDVLSGGEGDDVVDGGRGHDVAAGGAGQDEVLGQKGRDVLQGDDGDDFLAGGRAKDNLFGGDGADAFVFERKIDSGLKSTNRDVIHDFSKAEGDLIDFSAIKGKLTFIGDDPFSGDPLELRYVKKSKATIVKADFNGDGDADLAIKLDGKINLGEGDFIL